METSTLQNQPKIDSKDRKILEKMHKILQKESSPKEKIRDEYSEVINEILVYRNRIL